MREEGELTRKEIRNLRYYLIWFIIFVTCSFFEGFKEWVIVTIPCIIIFQIILGYVSLSSKAKEIAKFSFILCIGVLPKLGYHYYQDNISDFYFNKQFLKNIKKERANDLTKLDSTVINRHHHFLKLFGNSQGKSTLEYQDTLFLIDNIIVLSYSKVKKGRRPTMPSPSGGGPEINNTIDIYEQNSGEKLMTFDKYGQSLLTSYNKYYNSINNKFEKVRKPEKGVYYFDFWTSFLFDTYSIKFLNSWIIMLKYLVAFIFIAPFIELLKPMINYFTDKKD